MKSLLRYRILSPLALVLVVSAALAATVPSMLPWSAAKGRPAVKPGSTTGCFVWHDGATVTLLTTTRNPKGLRWTGRIELRGGSIVAPRGLRDEKRDGFRQPKPNVLEFSFDTHTNVDGVRFTLKRDPAKDPSGENAPKPFLCFGVRLEGEKTQRLFYGPKPTESKLNPMIFDLTQ